MRWNLISESSQTLFSWRSAVNRTLWPSLEGLLTSGARRPGGAGRQLSSPQPGRGITGAQGCLERPPTQNHCFQQTLSWSIPPDPSLPCACPLPPSSPAFSSVHVGTRGSLERCPLMSGYKPFLVPTVLSTERRNSRFLSAPTAQAQQGGRTRGAGKSGICRAVPAPRGPPEQLRRARPLTLVRSVRRLTHFRSQANSCRPSCIK